MRQPLLGEGKLLVRILEREGETLVLTGKRGTEAVARPAAELTLEPQGAKDEANTPPEDEVVPSFPATLFGRVVESGAEHPLADTAVEIRHPGLPSRGTRTDADGHFEIDWGGPMQTEVRALPKRGFVTIDSWKSLDTEERLGRKEIVLRLRRGRSDLVRGQVLNSLSGERVFSLQVKVSGSGLQETCTSDDGGLFETTTAFPEGKIRAELADSAPEGVVHLGHFERVHLEGGKLSPDWMMEVEIGPSYRVLPNVGVEFPTGSRIALREERPTEEFTTVLRYEPWGSGLKAFNRKQPEHGSGEDEETQWRWLTPRPGEVPWIRYGRQIHPAEEGTEPKLVLDDPTQCWRAEAPVPSTVGHHSEPIILPLVPSATISGRAADTTGESVGGALVRVHVLSRESPTVLHHTETLEDGSFELSGVDPGSYRMAISPLIHAGDEFVFRCDQGPNTLPPFLLPPTIDVGDIAGDILVDEDMRHSPPLVTLASSEGSQWRRVISGKSEGRVGKKRRYSFRFEHVPGGRYEVSIASTVFRGPGHQADWTPRKQTVLPPHEGLVFRSKSDGDGVLLQINVGFLGPVRPVIGQRPGELADGLSYGAKLILGPGGMLVGNIDLMRNRHLKIPRSGHLEWQIVSPFYRSVSGDERDLVFLSDKAVLDVKLRTGFSITFLLRGRNEDMRHNLLSYDKAAAWPIPIVGAKAYVNKKLVGRSDRNGLMSLDLARLPKEIGILAPGWKEGQVHPYWDHDPILWLIRDEEQPVR